ncbi:aspartyl aminopeptidase [Piedraia hortae CBS 480.64]|uniref:aspartyl aminopeptidase n=1 Tax=Piedraia hortae CBS 480.64 TaxID=1314780 RepID=A0A6A7BPI2_9PEZI|nr:aspartyl aminopeptidase [Piedraia hortae CBS 480.64]
MSSLKRAQDFVSFLNASPTPFHAVQSARQRLEKAGFSLIKERDDWSSLKPGGKYFVTRNASSIVAFAVGSKWKPGNPVSMVGAHTDSPCMRIKPVSKRIAEGYQQIGVELYGGGLWHTWFDRDLGVAGRVMVSTGNGGSEMRLVRISKPVCRIPNLAIHFGGRTPFDYNKETHLLPIAGLVSAELNQNPAETTTNPLKTPLQRHHPYLIELLAKEANCKPTEILDFECILYDTQPACLGGLHDEFIYSARLDNLGMTYCAIEGLIQSLQTPLTNDPIIRLIACFDNEEIGSTSAQGADSNFLPAVLTRLASLGSTHTSAFYEQTLAKSFLISADMAHAVNPNYTTDYESEHRPALNGGTVIKINANVRYATNAPGIVLLQECAKRAKGKEGVPLQLYVVKNDHPCGSTIGPMLAAKLGVRTIDVGNPQLAMHSIRETGGTRDVEIGVELFGSFFGCFGEVGERIVVD